MRFVAPATRSGVTVVHFQLDEGRRARPQSTRTEGPVFQSYEQFAAAELSPGGFVVETQRAAVAEALLARLRSDPVHGLLPAFLARDLGPVAASLADGLDTDAGAMHAAIESVLALAETLPREERQLDRDAKLLRFLYVRPDLTLVPNKDWRHPHIYFFPLLEALAGGPEGIADWLASLRGRNLLEPAALLDRLYLCPQCGHAHVSFIDVCPACRAIAIEQKPFLHCYACGHVAPQEDFMPREAVVCPKCAAHLRHIGVDYDRTLENFFCAPCSNTFMEPQIEARCLGCGAASATEALAARRIESLRLTEGGRLAARSGNVADVYAVLDSLSFASVPYFRHTLDWLLALVRRHPQAGFGLMCVRLVNVQELVARIGRNRVLLMMDGLAHRLRELIRATDIVTRTSEDRFLLLLPYTPAPGCNVLLERIKQIQASTRQEDGAELRIEGGYLTAPAQVLKDESAEFLIARLASATP